MYSSYDHDDSEFVKLRRSSDDLAQAMGNGLAADYFPLLRYIPTPALRKLKQCVRVSHDFYETHLNEHRKSYSPGKAAQQIDVLQPLHD